MATTFKLKRKIFALLAGGSGIPINTMKGMYRAGISNGTIKTGTSFTQWYRGTGSDAVKNTLSKQRAGLNNVSTSKSVIGIGSSGSAVASGSPTSALNKFGTMDIAGQVKSIDNHPKIQKRTAPAPQQPKKQYQAPGEVKIGKLKQWKIERQLKREAKASLPKPETSKMPNSQPTSTQSSNTGGIGWTGQGTEGQYPSREQNKQVFGKVGAGAKKVGKGLGYTLLGTTALAGYGIKKIDDAANGYN